jgi:hypothetical protein
LKLKWKTISTLQPNQHVTSCFFTRNSPLFSRASLIEDNHTCQKFPRKTESHADLTTSHSKYKLSKTRSCGFMEIHGSLSGFLTHSMTSSDTGQEQKPQKKLKLRNGVFMYFFYYIFLGSKFIDLNHRKAKTKH